MFNIIPSQGYHESTTFLLDLSQPQSELKQTGQTVAGDLENHPRHTLEECGGNPVVARHTTVKKQQKNVRCKAYYSIHQYHHQRRNNCTIPIGLPFDLTTAVVSIA